MDGTEATTAHKEHNGLGGQKRESASSEGSVRIKNIWLVTLDGRRYNIGPRRPISMQAEEENMKEIKQRL